MRLNGCSGFGRECGGEPQRHGVTLTMDDYTKKGKWGFSLLGKFGGFVKGKV
jgi:hypothetical protein